MTVDCITLAQMKKIVEDFRISIGVSNSLSLNDQAEKITQLFLNHTQYCEELAPDYCLALLNRWQKEKLNANLSQLLTIIANNLRLKSAASVLDKCIWIDTKDADLKGCFWVPRFSGLLLKNPWKYPKRYFANRRYV